MLYSYKVTRDFNSCATEYRATYESIPKGEKRRLTATYTGNRLYIGGSYYEIVNPPYLFEDRLKFDQKVLKMLLSCSIDPSIKLTYPEEGTTFEKAYENFQKEMDKP